MNSGTIYREAGNMYPLEAIKGQVRFFRLVGGLPIEPTNDTLTAFKTSKMGWVAVAMSVAVMVAGFSIVWIIMINGGKTFFDPEVFAENGVLFTDAICLFTTYYMNMAVMFFMIYAYWHKSRQFAKNVEIVNALPTYYVDEEDVKKIGRRNTLKVAFLYIPVVLSSALSCVFGLSAWVTKEASLSTKVLFLVAYSLNWAQCCFSAVVAATHLLKYQLFGYVSLQQKAYNKCLVSHYNLEKEGGVSLCGKVKKGNGKTCCVVKVKPHDKKKAGEEGSFHVDMRIGLDIQKAIKMFNETYGSFTFLEVGNDLISATLGVFLTSLIFASGTYDENGNPKNGPLFIGLSSFVFTIHSLTRFYNIMTCGQSIANGNGEIKESLKEILRTRHNQLEGTCRADLEYLLDKCSNPCPMRPLHIFDQNYSTGFSALGLCLTYIIVILQFKISE